MNKTKIPKYWLGTVPKTCDICNKPITLTFVDGATNGGPWANMCLSCHAIYGRGVGLGRGQEYTKQTDGQWLKTRG